MYFFIMISLKSFSEHIAPLLGLTAAALYERQRALVRIGELPEPAKGRGYGLAATPETVAILVLAVMVTDNLSEIDLRVHELAKARSRPCCDLTKKTFFVEALAAVFASAELAARVARVTVFRGERAAQIHFLPPGEEPADDKAGIPRSHFGRHREFTHRMEVEATLWGPVTERIEHLLHTTRETLR
jgi:hypothetical protein